MFRQHFERKIERKAPVRAEQWQSLILRQSYQLNSNPSERERTEIAKETGLSVQIKFLLGLSLILFLTIKG